MYYFPSPQFGQNSLGLSGSEFLEFKERFQGEKMHPDAFSTIKHHKGLKTLLYSFYTRLLHCANSEHVYLIHSNFKVPL